MEQNKKIELAFYADDFTGATDALEFLCVAGAKAILFLESPSIEQLAAFPEINAFGVAGKTRSLSPSEMENILMNDFEKIKRIGVKHIHYKVCSTFDSSENIGSIGKAIDCGAAVFNNAIIPVVAGHPILGRYCVFGNLFAQMGIGSNGKIFRLDRHPSMSKHPVTPMQEADLNMHLSKQTNKTITTINYVQQKLEVNDWLNESSDADIVLLDVDSENALEKVGAFLNILQTKNSSPLFSVGSSSVEMAMGNYWNSENIFIKKELTNQIEKAASLLVLSGSCSPITKSQIEFAIANGFEEVIIDVVEICKNEMEISGLVNKVSQLLRYQKNVIVHTGKRVAETIASQKIGAMLGLIAKNVVMQTNISRVVFAGGDTSSYAARAMDIDAVRMIASIVFGAPLCKAISTNEKINGLEVNFKGGQVGSENYFCLF